MISPRNQSDHQLDQLDRKADSDESVDLLLFCDLFLKTIFTAPQIENSDWSQPADGNVHVYQSKIGQIMYLSLRLQNGKVKSLK